MADILIRGMDLPVCCEACFLFFEKNFAFPEYITKCKLGGTLPVPWPLRFEKRADDCPLGELPPHGDLIDRDDLNKHRKQYFHGKNGWAYDYVEDMDIDNAPVVIPASKEQ